MSAEEQQEYYFDKKEEFIEYLDETFDIRLEQQLYEVCNHEVQTYERCMGIAEVRKGLTKYSKLRGTMKTMFTCTHKYHDMINCIGKQDNVQNNFNLQEQDKRILKNLFAV